MLKPNGYELNYVILTTQRVFLRCLSPQQVVLESMVVFGKGGEVFKVPTSHGQNKPKWPTKKIQEKPNKIVLLMVLNNGVA